MAYDRGGRGGARGGKATFYLMLIYHRIIVANI
jgi:hypothetical protein